MSYDSNDTRLESVLKAFENNPKPSSADFIRDAILVVSERAKDERINYLSKQLDQHERMMKSLALVVTSTNKQVRMTSKENLDNQKQIKEMSNQMKDISRSITYIFILLTVFLAASIVLYLES